MKDPTPPFEALVPKQSRDIYIVDAEGNELARMLTPFEEISDDQSWESRKRIANKLAAAGELYEALKLAWEKRNEELTFAEEQKIEEALMKAEGEQQ